MEKRAWVLYSLVGWLVFYANETRICAEPPTSRPAIFSDEFVLEQARRILELRQLRAENKQLRKDRAKLVNEVNETKKALDEVSKKAETLSVGQRTAQENLRKCQNDNVVVRQQGEDLRVSLQSEQKEIARLQKALQAHEAQYRREVLRIKSLLSSIHQNCNAMTFGSLCSLAKAFQVNIPPTSQPLPKTRPAAEDEKPCLCCEEIRLRESFKQSEKKRLLAEQSLQTTQRLLAQASQQIQSLHMHTKQRERQHKLDSQNIARAQTTIKVLRQKAESLEKTIDVLERAPRCTHLKELPVCTRLKNSEGYYRLVHMVVEGTKAWDCGGRAVPLQPAWQYGSGYYVGAEQVVPRREGMLTQLLLCDENDKSIGWVDKNAVLENLEALKTPEGIHKKALAVRRIELGKSNETKEIHTLRDPTAIQQTFNCSPFSIFFYVFKIQQNEGKKHYLLGLETNIRIEGKAKETLIGWLPQENLQEWNTALAVEVYKGQWAERMKGSVLADKLDRKALFFETKEQTLQGTPATHAAKEGESREPWNKERLRLPLLSVISPSGENVDKRVRIHPNKKCALVGGRTSLAEQRVFRVGVLGAVRMGLDNVDHLEKRGVDYKPKMYWRVLWSTECHPITGFVQLRPVVLLDKSQVQRLHLLLRKIAELLSPQSYRTYRHLVNAYRSILEIINRSANRTTNLDTITKQKLGIPLQTDLLHLNFTTLRRLLSHPKRKIKWLQRVRYRVQLLDGVTNGRDYKERVYDPETKQMKEVQRKGKSWFFRRIDMSAGLRTDADYAWVST